MLPIRGIVNSIQDILTQARQTIDRKHRLCAVNEGDYGHITWANEPPSRKTRLSDKIDMGYAGESTTIGEVMDTVSGPFCYFYI